MHTCTVILVIGNGPKQPLPDVYFKVVVGLVAYAGDTQIELVQPISGESMFDDFLATSDAMVQHVAYCLDESDYQEASEHLIKSGYPLIQSFKLPIVEIGYFDTRPAIGVITEIVGANKDGWDFMDTLKSGNF